MSTPSPPITVMYGQGFVAQPSNSSMLYTTVLTDFTTGLVIPGSALLTLTLQLFDTESFSIVNGVSGQNILNTDRGTIDNLGNLAILFTPADTAPVNTQQNLEYRSFSYSWTYTSGRAGFHQVDFQIQVIPGP